MGEPQAPYLSKPESYFGTARLDLLELLPTGGGLRLLEVGAGDGATLREAKRRNLAGYTVGIDLPGVADRPADGGADRFLHGDVETMELDLEPASFDAVLCGDVLEHLVDPWAAVARLAVYLRPGGSMLASVPNFRNHRALRPIVFGGDFRYGESGLLDRTHLRFFCRKNGVALFTAAGLEVVRTVENMGAYGLRHRLLDRLTLGLAHDFFVFQFLIEARKP